MKFVWDPHKNEQLKRQRGVSFEQAVEELASGRTVAQLEHFKYPNQIVYVVRIYAYVHLVPAYVHSGWIELKTVFPSRKYQKKYGAAK